MDPATVAIIPVLVTGVYYGGAILAGTAFLVVRREVIKRRRRRAARIELGRELQAHALNRNAPINDPVQVQQYRVQQGRPVQGVVAP